MYNLNENTIIEGRAYEIHLQIGYEHNRRRNMSILLVPKDDLVPRQECHLTRMSPTLLCNLRRHYADDGLNYIAAAVRFATDIVRRALKWQVSAPQLTRVGRQQR